MKGQSSMILVLCAVTGSLAKPPPTFLEYKDSLGRYSFGYSAPGSARSEVRSLDGSTRGSYSYVDGTGVIQSARYTADGENGFQIVATNLPQAPRPVEDTPEVAAARLDHLKALEAAAKLAEENPDMEWQPSEAVPDGEASDSVVIESAPASADDRPEDNKLQEKSTGPEVSADHRAESQIEGKEAITKVAVKIGVAGPKGESAQMAGKSGQLEPTPIESQPRAADSSRPNVPVVTTSFVIPGRVNLHSRIELDRSGPAVARFSGEPFSARLGAAQSSMPQGQGADFDPSMITPAGTGIMTVTGGEMMGMPDEVSRVSAETTMSSSNAPQQYSGTFLPGVIAPSDVYALAYEIGVDPFYQSYNPYRYFRYGIL